MKVKIKKLAPEAVIPKYAHIGDSGMDLTAISVSYTDDDGGNITYDTGIAVEIPEGHVGLLFPRSSNSKKELLLTNSVGVIDSNYRGSIKAVFKLSFDYWIGATNRENFQKRLEEGTFVHHSIAEDEHFDRANGAEIYALGDRIAQLIILPYPTIEFEEVEELSETERNQGSYGSTGR